MGLVANGAIGTKSSGVVRVRKVLPSFVFVCTLKVHTHQFRVIFPLQVRSDLAYGLGLLCGVAPNTLVDDTACHLPHVNSGISDLEENPLSGLAANCKFWGANTSNSSVS